MKRIEHLFITPQYAKCGADYPNIKMIIELFIDDIITEKIEDKQS